MELPEVWIRRGAGLCASAWLDKAPSDRRWSVVSADVWAGGNVGGGAAGGDLSNGANCMKDRGRILGIVCPEEGINFHPAESMGVVFFYSSFHATVAHHCSPGSYPALASHIVECEKYEHHWAQGMHDPTPDPGHQNTSALVIPAHRQASRRCSKV